MKKIKIEDITPDLILELQKQAQELRLVELTRSSLIERSIRRQSLIQELGEAEINCKIRAIRAYDLGISKKELAEIFNVTTREITKWIGR
jgi:DNA-binding transcriptional regulator YiaG